MTPDRRTLFALFALAFGVRILYAALVTPTVVDDPTTWSFVVARRIAGSLDWIGTPFTSRAPGFILALAAWFSVVGAGLWRAIVFNAFVAAATTVFIYRIGEQRLRPGVGRVAAVWFALYAHHVHFSTLVTRDVLTVFLVMWLAHLSVRPFHRMRTAVWCGVVFTALVHVEPRFLWLGPVLAAGYALGATHHRVLNLRFAVLFVATFFALTTPWMVRNGLVYREPIPVALEAAKVLRPVGRALGWDAPGRLAPATPRAEPRATRWRRAAVEFWRVVRLRPTPRAGAPAEPAWSLRHNVISLLQYGLLLPLAALAVWRGLRRRDRAVTGLATGVLAWFVVCTIWGGGEAARLPVEPILILLGVHGAFEAFARGAGSGVSDPGAGPAPSSAAADRSPSS